MWRIAHVFNKGDIVIFVIKAWSTFLFGAPRARLYLLKLKEI